jgi:hypothetical protein
VEISSDEVEKSDIPELFTYRAGLLDERGGRGKRAVRNHGAAWEAAITPRSIFPTPRSLLPAKE